MRFNGLCRHEAHSGPCLGFTLGPLGQAQHNLINWASLGLMADPISTKVLSPAWDDLG
jgi:hypothetical protein